MNKNKGICKHIKYNDVFHLRILFFFGCSQKKIKFESLDVFKRITLEYFEQQMYMNQSNHHFKRREFNQVNTISMRYSQMNQFKLHINLRGYKYKYLE